MTMSRRVLSLPRVPAPHLFFPHPPQPRHVGSPCLPPRERGVGVAQGAAFPEGFFLLEAGTEVPVAWGSESAEKQPTAGQTGSSPRPRRDTSQEASWISFELRKMASAVFMRCRGWKDAACSRLPGHVSPLLALGSPR